MHVLTQDKGNKPPFFTKTNARTDVSGYPNAFMLKRCSNRFSSVDFSNGGLLLGWKSENRVRFSLFLLLEKVC